MHDTFKLDIYEGHFSFITDNPEPQNIIHLSTDLIYPCCNYSIVINQKTDDKIIDLEIDSINIPSACLTALGPAKYYGQVALKNGDITLHILNGNVSNDFKLSVSDTLIKITPINDSYIKLSEQMVWRYRENSFVYSCGTMEATNWLYDAFKDSIMTIQGIKQFYYPDSGRIPYPREPSGYYVNHPCLFFQYENESDWELIKQKLADYSKSTITNYSGVGIYVENYLGSREWSWRFE